MLYNQYKCLQQYLDGVAQDVYKKGNLVKTADFDSLESCEKDDGLSTNCFSWINTTDNKIFYFINEKYYEATNSPVCIGKPYGSLIFYDNSSYTTNYNLTSLNLSYIDTSDLDYMQAMFHYCMSLESLNLSNFNTAKVTDMQLLFGGCEKLKSVNVSSFNTNSVLNFNAMFADCYNLTNLDLSSFTTASEINSCAYMFQNCSNLTKLNLSKFGPVRDTDGKDMFMNCDKLNHIICKESFKNWCKLNQDNIKLPAAMRNGGSGTWEIVG